MAITWTFIDGVQSYPCTSFPNAFRMMHNTLKKGVETGRTYANMTRGMSIISPVGTVYNHYRASNLAREQGLLTPDGTINSREFKKK